MISKMNATILFQKVCLNGLQPNERGQIRAMHVCTSERQNEFSITGPSTRDSSKFTPMMTPRFPQVIDVMANRYQPRVCAACIAVSSVVVSLLDENLTNY